MSTCLLDWAIATAGGSRASSGSPLRCILILWRPTHRSSVQASTTVPVPDPASSCSSANFVSVHSSCTLSAIEHPNSGIFRNSNYKMPSCRTAHLSPLRSVLDRAPSIRVPENEPQRPEMEVLCLGVGSENEVPEASREGGLGAMGYRTTAVLISHFCAVGKCTCPVGSADLKYASKIAKADVVL